MNELSERRLAENEVIFKQINTEVKDFVLEDTKDTVYANRKLSFYCECSNMDCRERISMTAEQYDRLHKGAKRFIAKPGHDMRDIERVVKESDGYIVVEKNEVPPAPKYIDPKKLL